MTTLNVINKKINKVHLKENTISKGIDLLTNIDKLKKNTYISLHILLTKHAKKTKIVNGKIVSISPLHITVEYKMKEDFAYLTINLNSPKIKEIKFNV